MVRNGQNVNPCNICISNLISSLLDLHLLIIQYHEKIGHSVASKLLKFAWSCLWKRISVKDIVL